MANTPLSDLKMTQVAELLYQQHTQDEICIELEINRVQLQRYIKALREEWADHRMRTSEEHFDEQLARLAYLERYLMPSIQRGYVPAFDRMLMLYDQRNKLLGLYAPAKSELDIGEQLASLLTKISEEAVEEGPDPLQLPGTVIEGEVHDVD